MALAFIILGIIGQSPLFLAIGMLIRYRQFRKEGKFSWVNSSSVVS